MENQENRDEKNKNSFHDNNFHSQEKKDIKSSQKSYCGLTNQGLDNKLI